jgi:hypothetical protein
MVRATATVWALEKDEFWVVLPNTTECTFTCGTKPPQTRQIKGQHRVRLGIDFEKDRTGQCEEKNYLCL